MKANGFRIVLLILALSMIVSILGCGNTQEPETSLNNEELQGENNGGIFLVEIVNMDEYNTFIRTSTDLPNNFVSWDKVNSLGSFYSFSIRVNTDFLSYEYIIDLENGEKIKLCINPEHIIEFKDALQIASTKIGTTMSEIAIDSGAAVYETNGLKYCYFNGKLNWIELTANGNLFRLKKLTCPFSDLESLSRNTIVGKLLSKSSDDQIAAFNQLKDMVTK